jgi:hypothetical protein
MSHAVFYIALGSTAFGVTLSVIVGLRRGNPSTGFVMGLLFCTLVLAIAVMF